MSLLGSVIGAVSGLAAAKKTNKLNKAQLADQKRLTDQQVKISDYIQGLSKDLMARGTNQVDPYGGVTGYDPTTGTYSSSLGVVPRRLQDASDQEELMRSVHDQALRRRGLIDAEGIRSQAAGEAGTALTDLNDFRRGIGAIDPAELAGRIRVDRQGQVNAGYDDAERAAQTLQLRTGSSAVGDALSRLARDRVRAQAEVGNPEVEALQLAEGINTSRLSNIAQRYSQFADRGSRFNDQGFTPAPYAGIADAKLSDLAKLDLSKFEVAQGGSSAAAAGIGSAGAGLRAAFAASEANRVKNPWGTFARQVDTGLEEAAKSGFRLFG